MPLKDFTGPYDIANDDQLIRYAAKAQVCLMVTGAVRDTGTVSQADLAQAMEMKPGNLSAPLNSAKPLSHSFLSRLDAAIVTLAPNLSHTGGLVAFAARLRGMHGRRSVQRLRGMQAWENVAEIPPIWTPELLQEHPDRPVAVLLQASALLSVFHGAHGEAPRVRDQYRDHLTQVVDRLILIGVSPPTPQSVEAIILLGSIAHYAFKLVRERLKHYLNNAPLGFRVWRVMTSIVHASQHSTSGLPVDDIKSWVRLQLQDCKELREKSIYPARSLDLELAIAVPADWIRSGEDWASDVLRERATSPKATVRERGTAALGLWERALDRGTPGPAKRYLAQLVKEWSEGPDGDDAFDSVRRGRKWVAETITKVLDSGEKVCNEWPESVEPCLRAVRRAAQTLATPSVPKAVLAATRFLFEHAILQNAGVYRRRAIDTLRAAGLALPVAEALGRLLEDEDGDADPWLRCRALFAIGFLQERGDAVQLMLREAYDRALRQLEASSQAHNVTRDLVSEVHAALFGIGDCFGPIGSEAAASDIRRAVDPTIRKLVNGYSDERFFAIPRAAAYLVTVTARPEDKELLAELARHNDPVTKAASEWALMTRFDAYGNLRPLHASA